MYAAALIELKTQADGAVSYEDGFRIKRFIIKPKPNPLNDTIRRIQKACTALNLAV